MAKKKEILTEQEITNNALLNVITPMGLDFTKNSLSVGENMGKVYGITRYPQKVDIGWLSRITNIPSTIVSIGFKPVDNSTLTVVATSCDSTAEEQPKRTMPEIKHISFASIVVDKKAVEIASEQTQAKSDNADTAELPQNTKQEQQTKQLKASTFKAVILSGTQTVKHTFFKLKSFIYPKLNPTPVQSDTALNLSSEVYNSEKRSL